MPPVLATFTPASPRSASSSDTCSYANGYRKYQRTAVTSTSPGYCRPLNGLAAVIGTASYPTKSLSPNFAMEPMPTVWNSPTTDMALKQRIIRILIQEIVANVDEQKQEV